MTRLGFVGQRLLQMVPVAIGVTILVFFMIHLVPGDPARTMLGVHATDQAVAVLHHKWGLDRSLFAQYGLFMGRLLHGNFGDSLFYRISARTLIIERLPATLWLIVYATLATNTGALAAAATHKNKPGPRRPDRPADQARMPSFWVGIMLICFFSLVAHLPRRRYGEGFSGTQSMFLPALTVAGDLAAAHPACAPACSTSWSPST